MAFDQRETSKKSMGSTQAFDSTASNDKNSMTTPSVTGSSGGDDIPNQPAYIAPVVAKQEEANIFKAKILVAVILLLAVASVSTSTYLLVKHQELSNFENRFAGRASEIATVARQKADQFFQAFEAYSISVSSQAAYEHATQNTSWPFHVIPDFSVKTQSLAELTGVENSYFGVFHIVEEDERRTWEAFVEEVNPMWFEQSATNEGIDPETLEDLLNLTVPYVYELDATFQPVPVTRPGFTVPYLQQYPLNMIAGFPSMVSNLDMLSLKQFADLFFITQATGRPAIGFSQIPLDDRTFVPGSQIIQPIYDTPDRTQDRKIVAIAGARLQFLDYFKNILTANERGILVVMKSACPRVYSFSVDASNVIPDPDVLTYKIDGPEAVLIGESDMHDPKYDALGVTEVFVDLEIDPALIPEGTCAPTITLYVYPSKEFEDSFRTPNPIIFTSVVALIFFFTSSVFVLYDFLVGRRQQKVMDRIIQQDMVVSNVFPTGIRERLYQNQGQDHRDGKKSVEQFNGVGGFDFDSGLPASGLAPLADLFPSVTVVFADIAGFTAWSSAREPQQVFVLLESIYSAFDRIAY